METTNVAPMLQPNSEQMRQHLHHLFGGLDHAYDDAKVELAWTDARDGKLRHAEIFSVVELDRIVERAVEINCGPNQNVYIGQALRHPLSGRARWCDQAIHRRTGKRQQGRGDGCGARPRLSPRRRQRSGRHRHPAVGHRHEWRPAMSATALLDEAEAILAARESAYGDPARSFAIIAARWSLTLGRQITPSQVALCMIDLKLARLGNDPTHHDSVIDVIGYAALLPEVAS
jgi:Domain of unknown function (DUF6378)